MEQLFLLGGYDLEMITIRDLLIEEKQTFFDKQLSWDTALLSAYQDELDAYGGKDAYVIYGIELRPSAGNDIIPNYTLIDHHNEYSDKPSALIQIAEILGHYLTRYEQLVAANDSAYIPGMQAIGATVSEIESIRYKDRRAQGVTDEDERLAEKAIQSKKEIGELWVVHSEISRFSPITDRLYPYKNLLVYTDDEWIFYGNRTEEVYHFFLERIKAEAMFYGGEFGFLGVAKGIFSQLEIKQMVSQITSNFN